MTAAFGRGLLDTSVFIASESERPLDESALPEEIAISAVTVAELHVGVLAAQGLDVRAKRLATLDAIADVETLPVDNEVAAAWALLRSRLAESGRRLNVNDLWIAATAVANGLPLITQDDDFEAIGDIGGLAVVKV